MMRYAETRDARLFDKLHVVTCVSNPCRYRSRYDLYKKFEQHVLDHGAELYTVEMAFGHRPFVVTEPNNLHHIQVRSSTELWHKENMLNLAINRLPLGWRYVAWIDADVIFTRPDWVEETIHQLQHYQVVQMFSEAQDLSPDFMAINRHRGFMWGYANGGIDLDNNSFYEHFHPGFAWAARKEAMDHVGGLIDWAILGSGDRHMACALIGKVENSLDKFIGGPGADKLTVGYWSALQRWQAQAEMYIRRNVGYVPGMILHHWHGSKRDRRYRSRWQILVKHNFDPVKDLKKDAQGLWQLVDHGDLRSIAMRDDIRNYFRGRNEDSIDVPTSRFMLKLQRD